MNVIELKINNGLTYAIASYGMTFLRLGIAIFIAMNFLLFGIDNKLIAAIGTIIIMVLDYYDGEFFNKSNLVGLKQWRVNRRVLDGTVDRIVIHAICLSLLIVDGNFMIFYLAILAREVVLSMFSTIKFYKGYLVYPGIWAKLACVMVGFTGISYLLTDYIFTLFIAIIMLTISIIALQEYRNTFNRFTKENIAYAPGKGIEEI